VRFTHRDIRPPQHGFTLVEMLMALAIGSILLLALNGVVARGLQTQDAVQAKNDLTQQAHFAMEEMVRAVSHSRRLLLPLADKTPTTLVENIREQTNPPSTPPAGSVLATAVLAVTLPATSDLDGNGTPDADNDGDGRLDEDLPADTDNDGKPGIRGIDDDGNGIIDYSLSPIADDDESMDLAQNEDHINGLDDDGDGIIDEDPGADSNGDGCAGVCGVDDDGDGALDEGATADDDEDGSSDEDWYDPVVFYLSSDTLVQRIPVPWDTDASGTVTGSDFIVNTLAENVTRFRVERIPQQGDRAVPVDLTLELTNPETTETVSLTTRVRVGGAL
jgi:prepilin-type N-terminal cleavage/methylation domain-containing protein